MVLLRSAILADDPRRVAKEAKVRIVHAASNPAMISVANGGVYTAIARDPLPGETEFGLIVHDDFLAN